MSCLLVLAVLFPGIIVAVLAGAVTIARLVNELDGWREGEGRPPPPVLSRWVDSALVALTGGLAGAGVAAASGALGLARATDWPLAIDPRAAVLGTAFLAGAALASLALRPWRASSGDEA